MEYLDEIDDSSQSRRWCFTINNPFGTNVEEIDISTNELPIKDDYYDKSVLDNLRKSDLFNFKYVKGRKQISEDNFEEFIYARAFFKDANCAFEYFKSLENFKYVIFSVERGENEETEHIQGFIIFNCSRRFRTVRKDFLFHHIEKTKGSNVQARGYCLKSDTHIDGPYESEGFCEERSRTDIQSFLDLVKAGASRLELQKLFPSLYLRYMRDIDSIYLSQFEHYKYDCRSVDVTYIYGPSRSGKSKYVTKLVPTKESYSVSTFENSAFTGYHGEDYIVIDEYSGQFNIQTFNRMLDIYPFKLRGLQSLESACYHHVYIISNKSPKDIYSSEYRNEPEIYRAFNLRLHRILRFTGRDKYIVERETEWEDCTDEEDLKLGLTKQVKCTYEFDSYGNKIYLYNRHAEVKEVQEIPSELFPFGEELVQEELEF